jgi:hypothetical protein
VSPPPRPISGKWYVSYPALFVPGTPPLGGPFDTEDEAREWRSSVLIIRGGVVWQYEGSREESSAERVTAAG